MKNVKRNWTITGGTGFIGRELVYHLLCNTTDRITLLCRKPADISRKRIGQMLAEIDPALQINWNRLNILQADFERDNLGISATSVEELSKYDNQFIHLAASTRFTNTLEQARLVNVKGTQNAFRLAQSLHKNSALSRFVYFSTAYVQGYRKDIVGVEDPLDPSLARNTYEQSKCEAELWIRDNRYSVPTVIFRPSIVIGDSKTGRSSGIATIYWAVKMLLAGHQRIFARTNARLDMVTVDYVIAAMLTLLEMDDSVGKCYPLVAGTEQDQTLSRLAEAISTELSLPKPILYSPAIPMRCAGAMRLIASLAGKAKLADQMLAYLPYFSENPRFDNGPTRSALENTEVTLPIFDDYIGLLLRTFADRPGINLSSQSLATA